MELTIFTFGVSRMSFNGAFQEAFRSRWDEEYFRFRLEDNEILDFIRHNLWSLKHPENDALNSYQCGRRLGGVALSLMEKYPDMSGRELEVYISLNSVNWLPFDETR